METKSYNYKGCVIYHNPCSSKFNTSYFSIVNPHQRRPDGKLPHCHASSTNMAKKIVDCFTQLHYKGCAGKYPRSIRNLAMRLDNCYILS